MARALVLGGGGVTGVAWELGILAGLADAGADLTDADLFVGTSAGSVVAAQVTGGFPLEQLYQRQLTPPGTEIAARVGPRLLARLAWIALSTRDEQRSRARMGELARTTRTVPEAERRAMIASRLRVTEWPTARLLITAVDAQDGAFVVFDRDSGVSLVDAVAASCAVPGVWPPSAVNGRLYIDGGMRSAANVDLVARQDRPFEQVVVVAPITTSFRRGASVAGQVATLPSATRCVVVAPDAASRQAIGRNVLDPARRIGAARAGRRQAGEVASQVADVWR